MKAGPLTKINMRSKKMSRNLPITLCNAIVIFKIYGQFGTNQKLDSGGKVCKTYIFINSNLLSYKN